MFFLSFPKKQITGWWFQTFFKMVKTTNQISYQSHLHLITASWEVPVLSCDGGRSAEVPWGHRNPAARSEPHKSGLKLAEWWPFQQGTTRFFWFFPGSWVWCLPSRQLPRNLTKFAKKTACSDHVATGLEPPLFSEANFNMAGCKKKISNDYCIFIVIL